jgi:lysophospholipase L1-like esterase
MSFAQRPKRAISAIICGLLPMRGINLEKKPLRGRFVWALLVVAIAVTGCNGSSPKTPTTPDPPTNPNPTPTPTAPSITCPTTVTAGSTNGLGVAVTYTAPTATGGVAPVTVSCLPPSGSTFPIATTTVTCTATAANNQTGSCSFNVTVTPPVPKISKTSYLAFGDSMTAGEVTVPVSVSTDAQGYPAFGLQLVPSASYPRQLQLQLSARYTEQTIQMTNSGVSGETTSHGASRFPNVIANLRPEVVLLLEGANDLVALGDAGISSAIAGMESMAKEARFRNARVYIGTLPPPRPGGKNTLSSSTVQAYNSRLASMARGEGAILVDLYSAMLPGVNTYIGTDGLHPNELGYQKMADTFFAAIRGDLEVRIQ